MSDDEDILNSDPPENLPEDSETCWQMGYDLGFEKGQADAVEKSNPWLDMGDNEPASSIDPKTIALTLLNEHPHTATIILTLLEPSVAVQVLKEFPEKVQPKLIAKIGKLGVLSAVAIQKLNTSLPFKLPVPGQPKWEIKGASIASQIIGNLGRADEAALMEELQELDPELAEEISDWRFCYEDLVRIHDHHLQILLCEIMQEDLLISLKTASDALKEKFYSNMSDRAAKMIKEDLESLGPMKISEVEKSQLNIVQVAVKLELEGKISLSRPDDEYV